MATAPIRSLAWEPPYAVGAALERQKDQKKKKEPGRTESNKIRNEKRRNDNWQYRNRKYHKRLPQATICQLNGQP